VWHGGGAQPHCDAETLVTALAVRTRQILELEAALRSVKPEAASAGGSPQARRARAPSHAPRGRCLHA
jgi:hypothetical protein